MWIIGGIDCRLHNKKLTWIESYVDLRARRPAMASGGLGFVSQCRVLVPPLQLVEVNAARGRV